MSQFFQIHPENPQLRLIRQAVAIMRDGGVIAYPTDSGYALGCMLGRKRAIERIRRIRRLDSKHPLSLVCGDLSSVGVYAKVDNSDYRMLKAAMPGSFTFILNATSEVPRQMMHPKRRTIGIRVPDNVITQALLLELGEPIISTTMIPPNETDALFDPADMRERWEHEIDLIIDGGSVPPEETTMIDLTSHVPELIRKGAGDWAPFFADEPA